jgi:hypothetical protein
MLELLCSQIVGVALDDCISHADTDVAPVLLNDIDIYYKLIHCE